MSMRSVIRMWALLLCGLLCLSVRATEVETLYNREYTFGAEDFAAEAGGIFVRSVPEESVGVFYLGNRVIRPGDVLDAERPAMSSASTTLTDPVRLTFFCTP